MGGGVYLDGYFFIRVSSFPGEAFEISTTHSLQPELGYRGQEQSLFSVEYGNKKRVERPSVGDISIRRI